MLGTCMCEEVLYIINKSCVSLILFLALAVFIRSPTAYEALKSYNVLQLPSRSTLQSYTGAFLHEPGASSLSIAHQAKAFQIFRDEKLKKGEHEPKADGVLIFDEVKVVSSLLWNSRSQKIVGLAMTTEDQASLHDIYRTLDGTESTRQTSYILQFLWRDLTSSFDIVGPFFTCCGSLASKFIIACILETLRLFQMYGFTTSVLVCDGAASNLTAIKATMGVHGAFGLQPKRKDPHSVEPFFINPFNPPKKNILDHLSKPPGKRMCRFYYYCMHEGDYN